ncbi:MAG TPA: hypothetical protein VFO19_08160 [Vicinamibacterales bacterium]|nr:hypothetical protein [Vicinamibacterales bacterium]
MKGSARVGLAIAALVAVLAAWLIVKPSGESVALDLINAFPTAKDRRPTPETFDVIDATISGETHRAIHPKDPSRIIWSVNVPENGWLYVDIGLLEQSWTMQGDGVLFMVGVSDGNTFDDLLSLVVNPFGNPNDRKWQPLKIDLSAYAGKTVDLIFNTRSSPPDPPRDDRNGDLPVWGDPRIVTR